MSNRSTTLNKLPQTHVKANLLSVQAHTCNTICSHLLKNGYDASKLEILIGLPLSALDDEASRIALESYYQLWEEAVRYTGLPDLAIELGSNNVMEGMGIVGHVFFNCKTLKSAIEHYQRYYQLINESVRVGLEVSEERAVIHYQVEDGYSYCINEMEYTVVLAAERARRLLQSGLDIEYVMFEHSEPSYGDAYRKFFKCPVLFDQPDTGIAFSAGYLGFPMPRSSTSLYRVLTAHLDGLMRSLGKRANVTKKVMAIVEQNIAEPDLDADYVADKLNMSRNTLYRHLKKDGYSYHEIHEEVRSSYAIKCLSSGDFSVTELAFILGFSEVSAFSRAFKRWTGKSPNAFVRES